MLSREMNETLTRVGPGTPMGDLMRRYWHPIAASRELEDSPFRTKEVRILGEDLVLFRDRSGKLGLIDRVCPHRRVNLAIGVVEADGLRCQYHGWKFDHTGRCVEQPFEDTTHPEDNFKAKCGIAGYPVEDLAGLVWAYMGPQPAPLLPHWEPLTWTNAVRDIAVTYLPCNWMQCQENSLDPVHAEWLHSYFGNYVAQIKGDSKGRLRGGTSGRKHMQIAFDEFEYGIIKRRMVEGDTGEEEDWKVGHPILFPNVLLTGSQYSYTMQWRVPIDDTHTYHVSQYIFPAAPGQQAPEQDEVPYREVPLMDDDKHWILNYTFNQDYMAWVTQGEIAQRDQEKLGLSDKGIIMFRHLLQEQVERVREGEEPMNTFRDVEKNRSVSFPMERVKHGLNKRPKYRPGEAGMSAHTELIEQTLATWDATEFAAEPIQTTNGANGHTKAELPSAATSRS
jgi:5,5'-dehydrodivanillate O-demethylase